jgi:hypothetical protein
MEIKSTTPHDLHSLSYARNLLENVIGWPAIRSNQELIGECVNSISKSLRVSLPAAHDYLERKIRLAREQRVKIDTFFFQQAVYNNIDAPQVDRYDREKRLEAQFRAHGCKSGWIYQDDGKVKRCPECARLPIEG